MSIPIPVFHKTQIQGRKLLMFSFFFNVFSLSLWAFLLWYYWKASELYLRVSGVHGDSLTQIIKQKFSLEERGWSPCERRASQTEPQPQSFTLKGHRLTGLEAGSKVPGTLSSQGQRIIVYVLQSPAILKIIPWKIKVTAGRLNSDIAHSTLAPIV